VTGLTRKVKPGRNSNTKQMVNKMNSFVFSTGRIYNGPQNLEITYTIQKNEDEFGTLKATFNDQSRGVKGKVNILFVSLDSTNREIGGLVLYAYDIGNYVNA